MRVHAHEFDARVVTRFEERIVVAAMQLRVFLERAGVDERTRTELEQMYVFTKALFTSVPVDRALVDGDEVNGYVVHHAPGHCPGQICMQVHNVLLTTDHVLPRITPHQSPESITPWTGLDHYLISLEKFRHIGGVDLALPGHEEPIPRLQQRIGEIEAFHRGRLAKVRALCSSPAEPKTTAEIARRAVRRAARLRAAARARGGGGARRVPGAPRHARDRQPRGADAKRRIRCCDIAPRRA